MKISAMIDNSLVQQGTIRTVAGCRRILVRMGVVLPMLVSCSLLGAQEANATHIIHGDGAAQKRQRLEERVERLARYLDVDEKQRSELRNILTEMQEEILNMRRLPTASEELQMDRLRSIEDKAAGKIRAVLTEEQRKKYGQLGPRNSNSGAQDASVTDWLKKTSPR
jgi:hypothetical protein